MLLKYFLHLDIIYLTWDWEYGLISSFSSRKMTSHWACFSTMGADILNGAIAWKLFFFSGKARGKVHKNISLQHWIVDFQIYKLYSYNHFFPNEKILKSESLRSHDQLYLHIKICKQNLHGETPQQLPAGQLVLQTKQWSSEAR